MKGVSTDIGTIHFVGIGGIGMSGIAEVLCTLGYQVSQRARKKIEQFFGWAKQSEEWKLQKRAVELNQGRAAMMGILGLMVHEQLGGSIPIVGQM